MTEYNVNTDYSEVRRDERRRLANYSEITKRKCRMMDANSLDYHIAKHVFRPSESWCGLLNITINDLGELEKTKKAIDDWMAASELRSELNSVIIGMKAVDVKAMRFALLWMTYKPEIFAVAKNDNENIAMCFDPAVLIEQGTPDDDFVFGVLKDFIDDTAISLEMRKAIQAALRRLDGDKLKCLKDKTAKYYNRFDKCGGNALRRLSASLMQSRECLFNELKQILDDVEEKASLRSAYQDRLLSALQQAGTFPRHCVYDRKKYLRNEVYIDNDGVTVSISPPPPEENDDIWQIRTGYRPKQGKSDKEKKVEATDAWLLNGAKLAVEDFVDFLNPKSSQKGNFVDKYAEESWTTIK